jgi:hypothetical protein
MFRKNDDHEQEQLFSPVKELPPGVKHKLENHWSSHFYEHIFTQIDEQSFRWFARFNSVISFWFSGLAGTLPS